MAEIKPKKRWIKKAIKRPGALHASLHVPAGENIPKAAIEKATHSENPKLRHRAELAVTLAGMHKHTAAKAEKLYAAKKLTRH